MSDDEFLQQLTIATPCAAEWNAMQGDDRVRFCTLCDKYVYNLGAMPAREAVALIRERDGMLCARILARDDLPKAMPRRPVSPRQFHIRFLMAVIAGVGALLGLTRSLWWNDEVQAARQDKAAGASANTFALGAIADPSSFSLLPPNCNVPTGEEPK